MREALEYDRDGVAAGELWRLFTGQLVHWSTTMLVADVAVLLVAGVLLAQRSRRLLMVCLLISMAAVGAAVQFLAPELVRYRGSSGIASALVVACALELAQNPGASRRAAIATLALGAVKLAHEVATGVSLSSGTLPPGVRVAPVAHLAGAASGAVAWLVAKSLGNRMLEARQRRARRSGAGQRGPRERRRKGGSGGDEVPPV
jgi:rhomboid family GlyGly-CTERM serine protease